MTTLNRTSLAHRHPSQRAYPSRLPASLPDLGRNDDCSAVNAEASVLKPTTEMTGSTPRDQTRRCRSVVAVVLTWRGRIGLFKRSAAVGHDGGRWHCITGYIDEGTGPWPQVVVELHEETGLTLADLTEVREGPVLTFEDTSGGPAWTVHTFTAATTRKQLKLNWEHENYRWVHPENVRRFDGQVSWLPQVLGAVATQAQFRS